MKKAKKLVALVLALFLALSACIVIPTQSAQASSSTTNQDVLDARDGVLLVVIIAQVGDTQYYVHAGSGFLIGESGVSTTVLTNYHVVHAYTASDFREALGVDSNTTVTVTYGVVVERDVLLTATVARESQEADFSVLTLEQPIYTSTSLVLADSDDYEVTDEVWALGFAGIVNDIDEGSIYNSEEVTVTSGTIVNLSSVNLVSNAIECFTHRATITYGNSGGPLVDSNGYVIGINTAMSVDSSGNNDYYYAIKINVVTSILDSLGIAYETASSVSTSETTETTETSEVETTTAPVETTEEDTTAEIRAKLYSLITSMKSVSTDGYTDDSVSAFEAAITAAETIYADEDATESEIQSAIDSLNEAQNNLTEESGIPIVLIAVIAGVVVVVIIVIVVVTSSSKKKKSQNKGGGQPNNTPPVHTPPTGPANNGGWSQPTGTPANGPGSYGGGDGPGTTLLQDDGAGATTVLNAAIIPQATLTRRRTGASVPIDKASFKIGKERRNVSLCISDNTNISRVHAEITYRDGAFYIRDNSSTNGTSVNGVGLSAGQERRLSSGDVLRLADEEFTFRQ